jgi:hypothetical protein
MFPKQMRSQVFVKNRHLRWYQNGPLKVEGFHPGCHKIPLLRFFMVFFSFPKSGLSSTRPADFYNIACSRLEILKILLSLFFVTKYAKNFCRTKYKAFYIIEYLYTEIFKHEDRKVNAILHVAFSGVKFGVRVWRAPFRCQNNNAKHI